MADVFGISLEELLVEIRQRKMKSICGIKNIILKEIQNIMM